MTLLLVAYIIERAWHVYLEVKEGQEGFLCAAAGAPERSWMSPVFAFGAVLGVLGPAAFGQWEMAAGALLGDALLLHLYPALLLPGWKSRPAFVTLPLQACLVTWTLWMSAGEFLPAVGAMALGALPFALILPALRIWGNAVKIRILRGS
jgi:hypothetical protein